MGQHGSIIPALFVGRSALRVVYAAAAKVLVASSATNTVYARHYALRVCDPEPDRIWLACMHIATYAPKRPIEPVIGSILLLAFLAFWADTCHQQTYVGESVA